MVSLDHPQTHRFRPLFPAVHVPEPPCYPRSPQKIVPRCPRSRPPARLPAAPKNRSPLSALPPCATARCPPPKPFPTVHAPDLPRYCPLPAPKTVPHRPRSRPPARLPAAPKKSFPATSAPGTVSGNQPEGCFRKQLLKSAGRPEIREDFRPAQYVLAMKHPQEVSSLQNFRPAHLSSFLRDERPEGDFTAHPSRWNICRRFHR